MSEFEKDLLMLESMINSLRVLSTSEEIADSMVESALFGITETMSDYLKELKNKIEEAYKNDNFRRKIY